MQVLIDLIRSTQGIDLPVKKVVMGANWTFVQSLTCGLASTQKQPPPHYKQKIRDVGLLQQKNSQELAQFALSDVWLEASLGIATINSMIDIPVDQCKNENAFYTLCRKGADKKVAIVGHFPFVEKLKPLVKELFVLELNPRAGDIHADQAQSILPQCDVIGISGTTLINHTFDQVLQHCRKDAFKIMIGPSTPMTPVLFDHGIDVVAGSRVIEPDSVYREIAQGANFNQLHGVQVLTMSRDRR